MVVVAFREIVFFFFFLPDRGGVLSRAFPFFRPIRSRQLSPAGQPTAEAWEGNEGRRGGNERAQAGSIFSTLLSHA